MRAAAFLSNQRMGLGPSGRSRGAARLERRCQKERRSQLRLAAYCSARRAAIRRARCAFQRAGAHGIDAADRIFRSHFINIAKRISSDTAASKLAVFVYCLRGCFLVSNLMRLAFDLLNHPLDGVQLIEASAGTGKTWTLCALYLRLLLEKKLDVGRILVVTFTRAAAAELRERIRARIHDLAHAIAHSENSEDPLARRWLADGAPQCQQAQLRLERALYHFDQAAIYTIHGFCQRALLDAPFASAHPPEFEIQEDDETLRLECAMTFWRAQVDPAAAADAGFTAWLIQHHAQPAALAALLARRSRKPLARLICGEKTARIGDNAGFEASALPPLFESARALWRAEREGIAHRLQRALPGLRKNVYRTDSIEAAFDAWNHYFDLERFAVDVPCVASRAPDSKAQLLCATRLKQSLNKGGCAPEHAFFTCADRLLEAHAGIERAHR